MGALGNRVSGPGAEVVWPQPAGRARWLEASAEPLPTLVVDARHQVQIRPLRIAS